MVWDKLKDITDEEDPEITDLVKRCTKKAVRAEKVFDEVAQDGMRKLLKSIQDHDEDVRNMEMERDAAYVGIAIGLLKLIEEKFAEAANETLNAYEKADKKTLKIETLAGVMKEVVMRADEFKRL